MTIVRGLHAQPDTCLTVSSADFLERVANPGVDRWDLVRLVTDGGLRIEPFDTDLVKNLRPVFGNET
jgi:hypothetical protein